ncbi:DMT family transporter [Streptomyces sp. SCA2-4]|nr:DMT family transporter [Streptomyces huiliensis]
MEIALLALAVLGISLSAPLATYAAAPALAIAFWRNVMASAVLVPRVVASRGRRPGKTDLALSGLAGLFLAVHFGTWIPSLRMTSVAASTALVCTAPLWTGVIAKARGRSVPAAAWGGMLLALVGVVVVSSVDFGSSSRAMLGDGLALVGGACMAAYLTVGECVRKRVNTATYTAVCYGTAAAILLVVCLATGSELINFGARTWAALVGLTIAGQLVGHSLLNRSLSVVSGSTAAVVSLLEVPGAAFLAAVLLGQAPAPLVYVGVAVTLAGVCVVIRAESRAK